MRNVNAEYYTVKEVAEHYRVSENTVRNWISKGQLTALKLGGKAVRISATALTDFEKGGKPNE